MRTGRPPPRARCAAAGRGTLAIVRRRLFNLAAAMSLVMMLAVVALWVRSHYESDVLNHDTSTFGCDLRSGIGEVAFGFRTGPKANPGGFVWLHRPYSAARRAAWSEDHGLWGFNVEKQTSPVL